MSHSRVLSPDDDRLVRQKLGVAVRGLDEAQLVTLACFLSERLPRQADPVDDAPPRRLRRTERDREGTWLWWGLASFLFVCAVLLLAWALVLHPRAWLVLAAAGLCALLASAVSALLWYLRVDDELLTIVLTTPFLMLRSALEVLRHPTDSVLEALVETVDDLRRLRREARLRYEDERLRWRARRAAWGLRPAQLGALVERLEEYASARGHSALD